MGDEQITILLRMRDEATSAIKRFRDRFGGMMKKVGIAAGIMGAAVVAGVYKAVNAFVDFQGAMNNVQAVSQATGAEMEALSGLAKQMGSSTKFSATEAAQGMTFLAQAGLDVDQIMTALPGTLNLAAAGGLDLAQAADIATNVMSGMGLTVTDLDRVVDVLAQTAATANTDVRGIGEAMSYVGPLAKAAGLDIDSTAAALALMADSGVKGSRAGTALIGILASLNDKFQKTDRRVFDATGKLRPFADILDNLSPLATDVTEVIRLFGREAGPQMSAMLAKGGDAFRGFEQRIKDSDGAAKDMADTMEQGLKGALTTLGSQFDTFKINVGEALEDTLIQLVERAGDLVQKMDDWVQENDDLINQGGDVVVAIADIGLAVTELTADLLTGARGWGRYWRWASGEADETGPTWSEVIARIATWATRVRTMGKSAEYSRGDIELLDNSTDAMAATFTRAGAHIADYKKGMDGVAGSTEEAAAALPPLESRTIVVTKSIRMLSRATVELTGNMDSFNRLPSKPLLDSYEIKGWMTLPGTVESVHGEILAGMRNFKSDFQLAVAETFSEENFARALDFSGVFSRIFEGAGGESIAKAWKQAWKSMLARVFQPMSDWISRGIGKAISWGIDKLKPLAAGLMKKLGGFLDGIFGGVFSKLGSKIGGWIGGLMGAGGGGAAATSAIALSPSMLAGGGAAAGAGAGGAGAAAGGAGGLMGMLGAVPIWGWLAAGGIGAFLGIKGFGGPSKQEKANRKTVAAFEEQLISFAEQHADNYVQIVQDHVLAGWDQRNAQVVVAAQEAYLKIGKTKEEASRDVGRLWDVIEKGTEQQQQQAVAVLAKNLDLAAKKVAESSGEMSTEFGEFFEGVTAEEAPKLTEEMIKMFNKAGEAGEAFGDKVVAMFNRVGDAAAGAGEKIGSVGTSFSGLSRRTDLRTIGGGYRGGQRFDLSEFAHVLGNVVNAQTPVLIADQVTGAVVTNTPRYVDFRGALP